MIDVVGICNNENNDCVKVEKRYITCKTTRGRVSMKVRATVTVY
jgi:hypothetical protein